MNKVILLGRLTKDSETRQTTTGQTVVNFTLAVQDGKDQAQFINCQAWNKTGEIISQYTAKGSQIAIEGKIQNRSWDKKDGTKGYATDIIVFQVELLGSKQPTVEEIFEDVEFEEPQIDIKNMNMPF